MIFFGEMFNVEASKTFSKKTTKMQFSLMSIWLRCIDDMDVPRHGVK